MVSQGDFGFRRYRGSIIFYNAKQYRFSIYMFPSPIYWEFSILHYRNLYGTKWSIVPKVNLHCWIMSNTFLLFGLNIQADSALKTFVMRFLARKSESARPRLPSTYLDTYVHTYVIASFSRPQLLPLLKSLTLHRTWEKLEFGYHPSTMSVWTYKPTSTHC